MKYRKKPVEIEAYKFDGSSSEAGKIKKWMEIGEYPKRGGIGTQDLGRIIEIQTLEGVITARAGDWIIKGVEGEFYPCKPDIFKKNYEKVNN